MLVDSCVNNAGAPTALDYLTRLGVDPSNAVRLIVATHWHDDHIRGIAQLVERCAQAKFCCPNAFLGREFLSLVDALERRHLTQVGSGAREIHATVSALTDLSRGPTSHRLSYASADCRLFSRGNCEVWSLSPDSSVFNAFLRKIRGIFPGKGETKLRVPSLSPNQVSVALWVCVGDITVLLGADVERQGWLKILDSTERPSGRASAVKVPHHGSENAYELGMWETMLRPEPIALLTPWARGGRTLPTQADVERIVSLTSEAYATANAPAPTQPVPLRDPMVPKTIRQFGIKTRRLTKCPGAVRLRRSTTPGSQWTIQTFGSACHLNNYNAA